MMMMMMMTTTTTMTMTMTMMIVNQDDRHRKLQDFEIKTKMIRHVTGDSRVLKMESERGSLHKSIDGQRVRMKRDGKSRVTIIESETESNET